MSSINGTNIERMRVNGNEIALAKINGKVVFQKNKLLKTFFGDSKQNTTSGKNIFNIYKFASDDSDYYHLENEKLICDSIDSRTQGFVYTPFEQGTYTLSTTNVCNISVHEENSNYLFIQKQNVNSFTFTLEENKNLHFKFFSNDVPYEIGNIQIEKGSTATKYEPYTGGKPSPNPDYPQKISSINGVNLKISNGSKELKIPINLQGNILAKVGDYADELQIYSNGDVILVKKIREYKMTGNENITYVHNNNLFDYQQFFDDVPYIVGSGLCDYYRYNSVQSGIIETMVHGEFALQKWSDGAWHKYNLMFKNTNYNNATNFKNHLAELYLDGTPVKIYYPRANSINTKIQNIKSELNSFGDYSNIEIETTYN